MQIDISGNISLFVCFYLKTSPGQRQAITWSNAGMGVTKAPFANFSITGNFHSAKV